MPIPCFLHQQSNRHSSTKLAFSLASFGYLEQNLENLGDVGKSWVNLVDVVTYVA